MQIVIEIPDIVKTHCDDGGILQTIDIIKLKNAVAHGKPLNSVLDEIRAEISVLSDSKCEGHAVTIYSWRGMRRKVFDIIDKYKAEGGGKE